MKTSLMLFTLVLVLPFLLVSISKAQDVKGNGNVVKKTYSVSSFNRIELNGIYNTIIKQGNIESVEIETDENLQSYIKPEVTDKTLQIEQTEEVNFKESTRMNVYITFKSIDKLTNNGVGNLKTDGTVNMNALSVSCNGVGNLELDLNSSTLNLEMSSVGNIELKGAVTQGDFQISGVGNIDAEDMKVEKLRIESSGVGNAKVYVTGEIQPTVNGAGNIKCKGNPTVKNLKQDGIGKFKLD
ncbi:MAG: DUF2807 domain-containing protein [Ignavibacteria bacterium]|nr:DUF2807 domain-containing protein [Ignavibacteria bacterium]